MGSKSPQTRMKPKKNRSVIYYDRPIWWGKVDSNHRRHSQQIYSLSPLATREFPHIQLYKAGLLGAGRRTRTPGLLITNQLLYQLSYTSISRAWWLYRTTRKMSRSIFIYTEKIQLLHFSQIKVSRFSILCSWYRFAANERYQKQKWICPSEHLLWCTLYRA